MIILGPNPQWVRRDPVGYLVGKEKWRDLNNNSLVVKVRFGLTSFLFTGDIMAMAEKELVATKGDALNSTVLIYMSKDRLELVSIRWFVVIWSCCEGH